MQALQVVSLWYEQSWALHQKEKKAAKRRLEQEKVRAWFARYRAEVALKRAQAGIVVPEPEAKDSDKELDKEEDEDDDMDDE